MREIDREAMVFFAPYRDIGVFGAAEVHGAVSIANAVMSRPSSVELLSVAVAIGITQRGHVCAMIDRIPELLQPEFDIDEDSDTVSFDVWWPSPAEWISGLKDSPLVFHPSSWTDLARPQHPLVLFENRLYLARHWEDERQVASVLGERFLALEEKNSTSLVDELFPTSNRVQEQVDAVCKSLTYRTSILMGGPGTGKTFTIARILAAAISSHQGDHPIRIALAAPTAKAATRMRESLLGAIEGDGHLFSAQQIEILAQIEPTTIHRLLGNRRGSNTRFAHDQLAPLNHDLIVIDEMSMVSLPLMARFLEALRADTRLVLVGDPDQLASVENGSIFPDLNRLEREGDIGKGSQVITRLVKSLRNSHHANSTFADAVRRGDDVAAFQVLSSSEAKTVRWVQTDDPRRDVKVILSGVLEAFTSIKDHAGGGEPGRALEGSESLRLLCAHRQGPYGVADWNVHVSKAVGAKLKTWSVGQVVVKTKNDVANGLVNGDTGVVVSWLKGTGFAFRRGLEIVVKSTAAIDDVELAYATTVHKAQGSEYSTVLFIVPPSDSPLCTLELLYTAATRAKNDLVLIGAEADIRHAITTRQPRHTGLVERLKFALGG